MIEYTVNLFSDGDEPARVSFDFTAKNDETADVFGQAMADMMASSTGITWTFLTYER
jgi:hypothetical protein